MRTRFLWWTIAKNDLLLTFHDKMFFFWLLVFPLFFAFIFGVAFQESSGGDTQVSLDILNHDTGRLSSALIDELQNEKYSIEVLDAVREDAIRTLIIPEQFTSHILKGEKVELVLQQGEGRSLEAGQTAYSHVLKGIIKIIARVVKTAPLDEKDLEARFDKTVLERLVTLRTESAGQSKVAPSGFTHSIPGTTVMFLLFTVLMYGGITILQERREGILERLSVSPASFTDIIGGKWLSRVILGMIQIAVLFIAGRLLFKVDLGTSIGGLFVIALAFSGSIAGLSIFLGSIIQKEEIIVVVNIIAANLMAALGGCWWPLEIVPRTVRLFGYLLPTGWTMDAFHKLIFFGADFGSVLPHTAALSGFTLLFLILAVRFFKIKR
jgi:ABC-2 type transport system permease protein